MKNLTEEDERKIAEYRNSLGKAFDHAEIIAQAFLRLLSYSGGLQGRV